MTAIIGILCKDGVVIGADSSATFVAGNVRTVEQPYDKLELVAGQVIVGGTGPIGMGQRFLAVVRQHWLLNAKRPAIEIAKILCKETIEDFTFTQAPKGQYGALVAFPAENKPQLCEFPVSDFQPELKDHKLWYSSMGSAQGITDAFLAFMRDIFRQDGLPTVSDALFAVTWTLEHAITINPGGVNWPARIAVLETDSRQKGHFKARILADSEFEEHRQHIFEAKGVLRGYGLDQRPSASPEVPEVPRP